MGNNNAHYARLNDRFEGRSLRLRRLGFRYQHIPEWDTAVFVRRHPHKPNRNQTVSASFVMCADDIVWADRLEELEGK